TFAVEQRVDRETAVTGLRAHQPEISEGGEFLAALRAGVDCQPTGGSAVVLVSAENAEIRGTEEHEQLILVVRSLERIVHAKAREPDLGRKLRRLQFAEGEQPGAVLHQASPRRRHLVDVHALADPVAAVEELHLEQRLVAPQRTRWTKTYVAVLIIGEVGKRRRQVLRGLSELPRSALPGELLHLVEAERPRLRRWRRLGRWRRSHDPVLGRCRSRRRAALIR